MNASVEAANLERILRAWEAQHNCRLALRWTVPLLVALLVVLSAMTLTLRSLGWPIASLILACSLILSLGLALLWMGLALRRRPTLRLARRYEALLGLQERLSTALELEAGRLDALPVLRAAQVQDAIQRAQSAPTQSLSWRTLRWPWPERAALACAALALALAMLLPLPAPMQALPDPALALSLDESRQTLQESLQAVLRQPNLSAEQREDLLRTLQARLDELNRASSSEQAFAALIAAANALENAADQPIREVNAARAEALRQLQEALQARREARDLAEALRQAQIRLQESRNSADLIDALRRASLELRQSQPSLSESLEQAAQAAESGQTQAAQQALDQAIQQAQTIQQTDGTQLQQAAQQARQAARRMAEGEARAASPSAAGQPNEAADGGLSSSQQGQNNGQQGQERSQQASSGAQAQDDQANSGEDATGQAETSQDSPNEQDGEPSFGREAPPALQASDPQAQGSRTAPQASEPGAAGREAFAPVYAPQVFSPQAGTEVALPNQGQEGRLIEGDFVQNPRGELSVPYNRVFSAYEQAARQAVEAQGLPPNLRPVVRAYFDGLRP
ncbi:MAG: hypothetical protein NZ750_13415 [Anaerolineae bacterium]|nr:hypothetical protein [Anaerolineae bacterium]MDW8172798.1 hypothetical protein [Anaerolineae bacterium]